MHIPRTLRSQLAACALAAGAIAALSSAPVQAQVAPGCRPAACTAPQSATSLPPAVAAPDPAHWPAAPAFFAAAEAGMRQDGRTRRWEGAVVGFVAGAGIMWFALNSGGASGGSTAPCNQRKNQDAWSAGHCSMAIAAGGLVLAPVGFYIGNRIPVGPSR